MFFPPSNDNFFKFHVKCPLFNKYCYLNLWLGSLDEYLSIKYCENYACYYVLLFVNDYLFKRYKKVFCLSLYSDPIFLKFVRSGFIQYLGLDFLRALYKNCLSKSYGSEKTIENFFVEYFQKRIKFLFEQDLLLAVADCIVRLGPNSFKLLVRTDLINLYVPLNKIKLEPNSLTLEKKTEIFHMGRGPCELNQKFFCIMSLSKKRFLKSNFSVNHNYSEYKIMSKTHKLKFFSLLNRDIFCYFVPNLPFNYLNLLSNSEITRYLFSTRILTPRKCVSNSSNHLVTPLDKIGLYRHIEVKFDYKF